MADHIYELQSSVEKPNLSRLAAFYYYHLMLFLFFTVLQQSQQEQFEVYKREMKTMRSELDQRGDRSYYDRASGGGADADDKVDDDTVRRQQRGRDWATVEDPVKVSMCMVLMLQLLEMANITLFVPFAGSLSCLCLSCEDCLKRQGCAVLRISVVHHCKHSRMKSFTMFVEIRSL